MHLQVSLQPYVKTIPQCIGEVTELKEVRRSHIVIIRLDAMLNDKSLTFIAGSCYPTTLVACKVWSFLL